MAPISRQPINQRDVDEKGIYFGLPCATHCINLLLEDIKNKKNVAHVIRKARTDTQFIYDHT